MWYLKNYPDDRALWFSDGSALNSLRGGVGSSCRLIIDKLGFLDLTEIHRPDMPGIDANGRRLIPRLLNSPPDFNFFDDEEGPVALWLCLRAGGGFTLGMVQPRDHDGALSQLISVSGTLKPIPHISDKDIYFIRDMIKEKYIPYQNIPESPGKTDKEIQALGAQLFPFTPYSFELALCVYDWTTPSFARMVIPRIFQYTSVGEAPYPLDQPSIAQQIWESNWPPYTPQDKDYLHSFMMHPAKSLEDVQQQLASVAPKLQQLCDTQNRVLAAATQSLPRTSVASKPQLYSGQPDMNQLGLDHFAIEFLECSLNHGPIDQELVMDFDTAMAQYIHPGKSITTKMVWSFADCLEDAVHYSNGILLIANPPDSSLVWDNAAYITPLSDDPDKIEYTFLPGTEFEVQSVNRVGAGGKQLVVIELQPKPMRFEEKHEVIWPASEALKKRLTSKEIGSCLQTSHAPAGKSAGWIRGGKAKHKNSGRRCVCIQGRGYSVIGKGDLLPGWKTRFQGLVILIAIWLLSYWMLRGVPASESWIWPLRSLI